MNKYINHDPLINFSILPFAICPQQHSARPVSPISRCIVKLCAVIYLPCRQQRQGKIIHIQPLVYLYNNGPSKNAGAFVTRYKNAENLLVNPYFLLRQTPSGNC